MNHVSLTDAELVVLSLVLEQPRHGYEIEQEITRRNMRVWTDLSSSSIYYVLGRLKDKGVIEKVPPDADREGVPRTVYRITAEGESVWKDATLKALSRPSFTYTNFLIGLHNLWNVDPAEALVAVKEYREWLETDLQRQRTELEDFGVSFFPLDELFDYGFVLGDAELEFLDRLIARLERMTAEASASPSHDGLDRQGDGQDGV
jgi:DNA-binding PadR family transcriptional regulator